MKLTDLLLILAAAVVIGTLVVWIIQAERMRSQKPVDPDARAWLEYLRHRKAMGELIDNWERERVK